MDTSNFRDLLIVNVDEKLYVVEAPAHRAEIGDLVSFDELATQKLGQVVNKMFCVKDEDEWNCISDLLPIWQAKEIYRPLQNVWEEN